MFYAVFFFWGGLDLKYLYFLIPVFLVYLMTPIFSHLQLSSQALTSHHWGFLPSLLSLGSPHPSRLPSWVNSSRPFCPPPFYNVHIWAKWKHFARLFYHKLFLMQLCLLYAMAERTSQSNCQMPFAMSLILLAIHIKYLNGHLAWITRILLWSSVLVLAHGPWHPGN